MIALTAWPAHANELVLKDGKSIRVQKIESATPTEVRYKQGGRTQTRKATEVDLVISTEGAMGSVMTFLRRGEDLEKVLAATKRARKKDALRPYARYFEGEAYLKANDVRRAVRSFSRVADDDPGHFYAPVGLYKASQLTGGSKSQGYLRQLASGKFGKAWAETGKMSLAMKLLAAGQAGQAKSQFEGLTGAASNEVRLLARCGLAHCKMLDGDTTAESTFRSVVNDSRATAAAKGYGWTGIGLAKRESDRDAALLALMRGVLLYPSNPMRGVAGKAGAELGKKMRLGADRLLSFGRRSGFSDYGGDQPNAELMRRAMRVSAYVVKYYVPKLVATSKPNEVPDLEFLGADAMKVIAQAKKDSDMLTQYEKKIKALRAKYPDHARAGLAGINAIEAGKARALVLVGQANEAKDNAKKEELMGEARKLLEGLGKSAKATISTLAKTAAKMLAIEAKARRAEEIPEKDKAKRRRVESERDLTEFYLGDIWTTLAKTFPEGNEQRKGYLDKARSSHMMLIEGDATRAPTGNDVIRNFAMLGLIEVLTELGELDMAITLGEGLTDVTLWYNPRRPPKGYPKAQISRDIAQIKGICIQAHILLVRALVKNKQGEKAYKVIKGIDSKQFGKGWREHPMALMLTFERAKAMAGSGRGAEGAMELYRIAEKEKGLADKGDKAARRRWVDACKALSEIADVTGGEIYTPAIQFYTGFGYFCRGKPELSIAGYKGVLTAARTRKEREEWVPKAVQEIGNRLFQEERFLEAALAYQTVFVEFPQHPLARKCVKYALSASKRAIAQFGEEDSPGAITKFYKALEQGAVAAAGEEFAAQTAMRDAAALQIKQQWVRAAEAYLQVPEKTKKGKRVSLYPNALANAGYCYSQAYKKQKKEEHLKLAKEKLQEAARVSAKMEDREAQALACYYLGQVERKLLKNPAGALEALEPFDGALSGTTKYIVRARYEQALAHLSLGKDDAADQAEEYFSKIESRTSDKHFSTFAYTMVAKLRSYGNKKFKKNPKDIENPRLYRAKAARYAKLFVEHSKLKDVRQRVLFYLADVLFEGGKYSDANKVYGYVLENHKPPAITTKSRRRDIRTARRFDGAALLQGVCLAKMGRHEAAVKALLAVRKIVYIRDNRKQIVGRGIFKKREWEGPFTMKYEGRTMKRKVMFTTLDVNGKDVKFFDVTEARGDERFTAVEGSDPSNWDKGQVRSLELLLKRDYMLVEGMTEALWGQYQQDPAQNKPMLAKKGEGSVQGALNDLRYVLKNMDSGTYTAIVAQNQFEPIDHKLRVWQADIKYLKLKMAREMWAEVVGDIGMMKSLGRYKHAPASIKPQIDKILAEAQKKAKG